MELFLSSPETHRVNNGLNAALVCLCVCTRICVHVCVYGSVSACVPISDHMLTASRWPNPFQCNLSSKWTHWESAVLCNYSPTAETRKLSFCRKLSCHDCYTAQVHPRKKRKKIWERGEEWILKQQGAWKNSTLLDWNANTEGSEREFTNSSTSTSMHNSSHDIEAPLTIQTHTILLQIKTEFEEPFSEFHKAFFPPFFVWKNMYATKTRNSTCLCDYHLLGSSFISSVVCMPNNRLNHFLNV